MTGVASRTDTAISDATVGRLPIYLRTLGELAADDLASVSSARLASMAGVNSATLRRDLSSLDIRGTRGVGYDVKYLVSAISAALGVHQVWPVAVIGAGNLGRALANYGAMVERGFPVRAIFDVDTDVVGTTVAGLPVTHLDRLPEVARAEGILVAVVATPPTVAQSVADAVVAAGITSVLNFTGEEVDVPDGVVVRRVDLATELQILSFYQQRGSAASRLGFGYFSDIDGPVPPR
ncbi:MAG: redox-sensing transcriptional repressor Rex [Acidimicrobiia bacterium]|nr:redox-sensing transcriptional repressor Rex [Acidimicrobiia bacterium]